MLVDELVWKFWFGWENTWNRVDIQIVHRSRNFREIFVNRNVTPREKNMVSWLIRLVRFRVFLKRHDHLPI